MGLLSDLKKLVLDASRALNNACCPSIEVTMEELRGGKRKRLPDSDAVHDAKKRHDDRPGSTQQHSKMRHEDGSGSTVQDSKKRQQDGEGSSAAASKITKDANLEVSPASASSSTLLLEQQLLKSDDAIWNNNQHNDVTFGVEDIHRGLYGVFLVGVSIQLHMFLLNEIKEVTVKVVKFMRRANEASIFYRKIQLQHEGFVEDLDHWYSVEDLRMLNYDALNECKQKNENIPEWKTFQHEATEDVVGEGVA